VGLLDRISAVRAPRIQERSTIDSWINDYLVPANSFNYNGVGYNFGLSNEIGGTGVLQSYDLIRKTKQIAATLPAYADAVKKCPPVFAAEVVRAQVLSQARFTFRRKRSSPQARKTYGTNALSILENPWPGATTGDLIQRMEWHAGLAGNAYVTYQNQLGRQPRLRVLRPDWVAILYGSDLDPDDPQLALDGEILTYIYCNGGFNKVGGRLDFIFPEDMAHWFPIPDPESNSLGMSWITPAAREMQADGAANEHKLNFFRNGATPNLVIKGIPGINKTKFDEVVDMIESRHSGTQNAYKTLYLSGGADATVVGSNFSQMNFEQLIGAGETRISSLSRVPAIILGLSEGLKGSALNAGNFGQVRRMFADTWVFPTLENLAASLAPIIAVPSDSELWIDVTDMPILREDAVDLASITQIQASTVVSLTTGGFTADSAVGAVLANDMGQLKQLEGWVSVQLQKANAQPSVDAPVVDPVPKKPAILPAKNGK
jgi:hypothetical protein